MTHSTEFFIGLAQEIMRRAYAPEDPVELAAWIVQQVSTRTTTPAEGRVIDWSESLRLHRELMQKRAEIAALPANERREMAWAWASWNKLIDPLEAGMLALLSAGDGQGKTAYAETQAEYWARQGFQVVFCHFELSHDVMADRRAVRATGIPRRTLRTANLTPGQWREYNDAIDNLGTWAGGITYLPCPAWTAERTIDALRRLKANGACDVVIIDYLEKIMPSTAQLRLGGANVFSVEANNVELFKSFGEVAEVPVLMLAQLNKAGKAGGFDNLDRTSIRGAGEKSEKSNVVILIHREREGQGYSNTVQVRIDKNTMGPTGDFQQVMNPARFQVADMAVVK